MEGDMSYHTYLNPMPEGLFSSAHANTYTQNLFYAKSPSELGLFIIDIKIGCGTLIWADSRWYNLTQILTKLG